MRWYGSRGGSHALAMTSLTKGVTVSDPVVEALAAELSPLGLHRDGRGFRTHNALGDGVVVTERAARGEPGTRAFYVDVGLICVPWVEWVRQAKDPIPPHQATVEEALWTYQVGSFLQGPPWELRADNEDAVIAAMRARVAEVAQAYLSLLDRTAVIDALRRGDRIPGSGNRRAGLLVLLASQGINDEFVERFRAMSTKPERLDWIWGYAVRHTAPGRPIPQRPTT
jgi:hypothetical protein